MATKRKEWRPRVAIEYKNLVYTLFSRPEFSNLSEGEVIEKALQLLAAQGEDPIDHARHLGQNMPPLTGEVR